MRPLRPLVAAPLLVTAILAGCFAGQEDAPIPPTDPWIEYYTADFFPAELDHNHKDPALHNQTHNIEFVDYHDCTDDGVYDAATTPGVTDVKEWEDYLFVNQATGFCILDISDPTNVSFVSHFEAERGFDIDVSADGQWAFHATQRNPPPATPQDLAAGSNDDLPRGVYVVNVADKAQPRYESFYPMPSNGVHTVHAYKHTNGEQLVILQTYDWLPPGEAGLNLPVPAVNAPATQRVEITRLVGGPNGQQLERLSVFTLQKPATEPFGEYFPHDCTVQEHPFRESTLMYCAYWNYGMAIVDISNPRQPALISRYNDLEPSRYNQYHYVLPSPELIDERHITIAAPELQQGVGESGYIRIFDTTDPSRPEQIGAWTLPGVDGFPGGFLLSPHQFDVRDGKIYMGHNHGGVWVIDVSNATNLESPKSAGFYFPRGDERLPQEELPLMGAVWVAVEHRGYVYAADTATGIHVLRYVHDAPHNGTASA